MPPGRAGHRKSRSACWTRRVERLSRWWSLILLCRKRLKLGSCRKSRLGQLCERFRWPFADQRSYHTRRLLIGGVVPPFDRVELLLCWVFARPDNGEHELRCLAYRLGSAGHSQAIVSSRPFGHFFRR